MSLRVRNWAKFQHYKDRGPLWIKLYVELLDNPAYLGLPDAAKGQLCALFLLAAKRNNVLPDKPSILRALIGCTGRLYTSELLAGGWLEQSTGDSASVCASEPASNIASVDASAASATSASASRASARSREGEGETERETTPPPTTPRETSGVRPSLTTAQRLVIAANQAAERRWGEQTRPLLPGHGPTVQLVADLDRQGIPVEFAERSVVRQIDGKADGPPRSMGYFAPGIAEDWQREQVRALGQSAPTVTALPSQDFSARPSRGQPPRGDDLAARALRVAERMQGLTDPPTSEAAR